MAEPELSSAKLTGVDEREGTLEIYVGVKLVTIYFASSPRRATTERNLLVHWILLSA